MVKINIHNDPPKRKLGDLKTGTVIKYVGKYWVIGRDNTLTYGIINPKSIPVLDLSELTFDGLSRDLDDGEFTVCGVLVISD